MQFQAVLSNQHHPEFGVVTVPFPISRAKYDNTEVITAVTVSGGQSDPDDPVSVKFRIGGTTYTVSNVYYPSGDSQLAWVKWTTPGTEQDMVITVTVIGSGSTSNSTINVRIVDLDQNKPPNPVADDRNDGFSYSPVPNRANQSSTSWGVWRPWWQENWVWYGDDEDGYWVDEGWREFDYDSYTAKGSRSEVVYPVSGTGQHIRAVLHRALGGGRTEPVCFSFRHQTAPSHEPSLSE